MERLQLKLFGNFGGYLPTGGALMLPTNKSQALLAYLAVRPGHPHSREKLTNLLWGDSSGAQARQSFRQALSTIRKAVGDQQIIIVDGASVALAADGAFVDVVTFEKLACDCDPAALQQAASLYDGDLLESFDFLPESFVAWLRIERERLRELALQALSKLLAVQRDGGDFDAGIQTAIRMLMVDPLQEAAHRSLMQLYASRGRTAAALRQYQTCIDLLQRELGVGPDAATRRVYQDLLQGRVPESAVPPKPSQGWSGVVEDAERPKTPMIGRARELSRLHESLRESESGNGRTVILSGDAGVGKSRLLEELGLQAIESGFRLLVGRCYETERILPFGAWVGALRRGGVPSDTMLLESLRPAWRLELGRLVPEALDGEPGQTTEHHDHLRLFEAVMHVLATLANRVPICVVLEDIHWADQMSLSLLCYVSRRIANSRAMLVCTLREEDLSEVEPLRRTLEELRQTARIERLALAPLTQPDTLSLVRALAPVGKGAVVPLSFLGEQIWRNSQGNPLVIVETIRTLQENPPREMGAALPLPARIYELIANRIDRLGRRAQHLVAVAAVIGRAFDFQLLQRAANLGPEPAAEGVEELVRRGIFRGVGEAFDFSHDRVREVAYQRLPRALQRELHHHVALALEALYSNELESQSTALGFHFEKASLWKKAAHYFRLAGLQAFGQSANRDAVAFFERGLSALTHPSESREMLALAIDIRLDLRNALWQLGELAAVLDNLRQAERLARRLNDPLRLGWVSAFMGFQLWLAGDPTHGRSFGNRACRLAKHSNEFALGILAGLCVGMNNHALGDFRTAEDCFAEIVHLLSGARSRDRFGASGLPAAQAHAWLGWCLAERGQFDKVIAHGRQAVRISDAADHPWSLAVACWALGHLHIIKGELGEAVQILQRGLALCCDWRLPLWSPLLTWLLGYAHVRLGRITDGMSLLTEAVDTIEARGLGLFHSLALVHSAEGHMLGGRPNVAFAIVERAISLARDRKQRPCEGRALRLWADIAAAAPQPNVAEAEKQYGAALAIATELGMCPLVAECHLGLGTLYRRLGKIDAADENLKTAASTFQAMGIARPQGTPAG